MSGQMDLLVKEAEVPDKVLTSEEAAFEEFARLTLRKRALEDELAGVDRDLKPLGEALLAIFQSHPKKGSHKTMGLTIYQKHEIWARCGPNKKAAIDALMGLGYDFESVASINASWLSGVVREYIKAGTDMAAIVVEGRDKPIDLAGVIAVDDKMVVRATKS